MGTKKIKITKKILLSMVLLLALTLTINTGFVSATNNTTINQSNHNISFNNPSNNTTSNQLKYPINTTNPLEGINTTNSSAATLTTKLEASNNSISTTKTIKVLIYDGIYSIDDCVTGIEDALKITDTENLVPGYYFTYATSTIINAAILASYDVLAMPGGTAGSDYLSSNSISGTAIKNFVASGKGYLGICAGAYSGSYYVNDMYHAWGVAPDVSCEHPDQEGNLTVQITSAGQQLFGYGGIIIMAHYNGPAMYVTGTSSNVVTFATYADNILGYKGYGAIMGDSYGNGRSVLVGPHPELYPTYPSMVVKLILWAANPTAPSTVTVKQVAAAASSVKTFIDKNNRLPNYVTISNQKISVSQFGYELAKATTQVNNGVNTMITIGKINPSPSPTGNITTGKILKSEYLSIAQSLISFITANGRSPNYVNTSLGKMSFNSVVYLFSKIMSFYNTNNRLPNYVTMTS
jgi:glutamine amidotransferase-like uncharacterized protein/uncharacterized protein YpmS